MLLRKQNFVGASIIHFVNVRIIFNCFIVLLYCSLVFGHIILFPESQSLEVIFFHLVLFELFFPYFFQQQLLETDKLFFIVLIICSSYFFCLLEIILNLRFIQRLDVLSDSGCKPVDKLCVRFNSTLIISIECGINTLLVSFHVHPNNDIVA